MTQSLKIGFVLDTSLDPMDGVQQYVLRTGEWLASQGHEVHYLVGETKTRELPNVHSLSKNFRVSFNGNKTTIPIGVSRKKVRALLAKEKFDILHVQSPHHPFMAQRIVTEAPTSTAVVTTFHILPYGTVAKFSTKLLGYVLRPSIKRTDTLLAVSPSAANFAQWSFGRTAIVSPNVFDYSLFAVAEGFERYADGRVNILFFGRLVERKGCGLLLEAVSHLDKANLPSLRVIICGKGPLRESLEQQAKQLGISDIVEFTGFVSEEDKPRYYASAAISVFPSTGGESFGIVLLEAMACGKAVVLAGNNPGYATVMEPRPDLLFDPHDSTHLATLLDHFIRNQSSRTEAAKWGHNYTKKFDVQVVGLELIDIYKDAIAKRLTKVDNGSNYE